MFNLDAIRKQILSDDDFVLSEVKRLQQAYKLKHEVRFALKRNETHVTESVAEHIYGMHVCAQYFLPVEENTSDWNKEKIMQMITWHDISETITGDIIGYLKTPEDRAREVEAAKEAVLLLPESIQERVKIILEEYELRETTEAKFVKALDKIDVEINYFTEFGKKIMLDTNTTYEQHTSIIDRHVAPFPYIKRFSEVITKNMQGQGFFVT